MTRNATPRRRLRRTTPRLPVLRRLGQILGYMLVVLVARRFRTTGTPESPRVHRRLNSAPGLLELSGNEGKCSQWHAHVVSGIRTSTECTGSAWESDSASASRICQRYAIHQSRRPWLESAWSVKPMESFWIGPLGAESIELSYHLAVLTCCAFVQ